MSSVAIDTSHEELGAGPFLPLLLFKLILSLLAKLMVLVFLDRVFLGAITMTAEGEI